MVYIQRILEKKVFDYIKLFPSVGITGPRQSGKSTLLLHLLKDYQYVTFDDYKNIAFYEDDPDGFIEVYQNKVIFDEVQRVPKLFHHIKMAIDKDRENYGKFILTGSSQFAFLKEISESLAGRIGLLSMLPLQFSEIKTSLKKQSIYSGGYPELVLRNYEGAHDWYSSYLNTYLTRDIRDLISIGDLSDFRRLIELLAANTSHVLNMSRYANDIGVTVQTIKRWISVLEASYIIFLLKPYHNNYGKRIIKSPKIYFYDTGLVSYLTGIKNEEHFSKGPLAGPLFENYIVSEVLKKELSTMTHAKLYYLRLNDDTEIDLIVDRKNHKELIEIKFTSSFKPKMVSVLKDFIEKNDKAYLLYNGKHVPYTKNINIINYQDYLKIEN